MRVWSRKPEGKAKASLIPVRSRLHLAELLHEDLRSGPGGSRILTGSQQAVADDVNRPVLPFREDGAEFQHLVFDKKGHHFGEVHLFLLAVGEAGNLLALNQRLAVRCLDVMQRSRGMTHQGDRLARSKEGFDQLAG